jgi:hypothetical protein
MGVEEITKIIAKDMGSSGAVARRMAERITELHKDLSSAVADYLEGNPVTFTFGDISLQTIMHKEHCSLVESLFSMNVLLENPELAAKYQSIQFRTGCLEE